MAGQIFMQGLPADDFMEALSDKVAQKLFARMQTASEQQEEKLLAAKEAVKIFVPAITTATLNNWASEDKINRYTIGRSVFYKKSEILAAATSLKRYKRTL